MENVGPSQRVRPHQGARRTLRRLATEGRQPIPNHPDTKLRSAAKLIRDTEQLSFRDRDLICRKAPATGGLNPPALRSEDDRASEPPERVPYIVPCNCSQRTNVAAGADEGEAREPRFCRDLERKQPRASPCGKARGWRIPSTGVEKTRFSSRNPEMNGGGDVKSDVGGEKSTAISLSALHPEIMELATQLASLPPETLAALRALIAPSPRRT